MWNFFFFLKFCLRPFLNKSMIFLKRQTCKNMVKLKTGNPWSCNSAEKSRKHNPEKAWNQVKMTMRI